MKLVYVVFVIFLGVGAQQLIPVADPRCPPPGIGPCVLSPNACSSTLDCKNGQICCSVGCNKECTDPNNPGTCPPPRPLASTICPAFPTDQCSSDADCSPNTKCCDDPCGKQCLNPNGGGFPPSEKPGSCKLPPSGILVKCAVVPDDCKSDSDCSDNKKCCKGPCKKFCDDPVPSNSGTCPDIDPLILCSGFSDKCYEDSTCSGTQKCCPSACGNICSDSETIVHEGTCPATIPPPINGPVICPAVVIESCTTDADCKPDQKCCDDPCGIQCKRPVDGGPPPPSDNPGVCPFFKPIFPPPPCAYNPLLECHSDSECAKDQKCCSDFCFPKCLKSLPDIVRPGLCPFLNPLIQARCIEQAPECKVDAHCGQGKKCCRDYCGFRCKDIVQEEIRLGQCSLPSPIPLGRPCYSEDLCRGDQDCSNKNQKCCKGSCGTKECLNLVPLVQGECPQTSYSTIPQWFCSFIRRFVRGIADECETDTDCSSQGYKCCKDLCRSTCKKPVKPAAIPECPDSNPDIRCVRYNEECKSDNDCGRPSTCCRNNCGTKCYSPFPQRG